MPVPRGTDPAFVGAAALRTFGAGIYVADIVALAMVREMAAVATAIVMAGRTGSAYAARLATMQQTFRLLQTLRSSEWNTAA